VKRVAIAVFIQETGTFNPEISTRAAFAAHRLEMEPTPEPTIDPGSELAGAMSVFKGRAGYETVALFQAHGGVGGRVSDDFVSEVRKRLTEGLQRLGPFDGCLLLLHGACASESDDDVDGLLVEATRKLLPTQPVSVALDHHANVTTRLMSSSSVVVGHRTEPHRPDETAAIAARLLTALLEGRVKPTVAWVKVPMLVHQEHFETNTGPMHEVFSLARSLEVGPILAVSPFPMQPWLDVSEGGWAVVTVANDDPEAALFAARYVAREMWRRRGEFAARVSVDEDSAVDRALALDGLGIICDMGDGVFAGAAGDSPRLAARLVARRVPGAATVRDRAGVKAAWEAGVGARVSVSLGGEVDSRHAGGLVVEDAIVEGLSEGPIAVPGLMGLREVDEGRTALLRAGSTYLHLTELRGSGGCHPASFQRYGLDVGKLALVVLKQSAYYHTYDEWLAGSVIRANTPGLTQSDLGQFQWRRLPRPIFGLDPVEHPRATISFTQEI